VSGSICKIEPDIDTQVTIYLSLGLKLFEFIVGRPCKVNIVHIPLPNTSTEATKSYSCVNVKCLRTSITGTLFLF
jgi:hypothetical protein